VLTHDEIIEHVWGATHFLLIAYSTRM